MGMEDKQSWTNREIIRETEARMAHNQKRAIQLLKLMNGDDDDDDDDCSSEHNSAIAEGEGEGEGEGKGEGEVESHKEEREEEEDAVKDDFLVINMDNSHSDMKYGEKGDVVTSSSNRPTTITAADSNQDQEEEEEDRPVVGPDQAAIEAAVEKLNFHVDALNMNTTSSAEMPHGVEGKAERGPNRENSGRGSSSFDEEGLLTPPLIHAFKMDDEDSDEEGHHTRTRVSPLERLRSGRFSRTATRRSSRMSSKSSPSSRPGTRPGTANGVDESPTRLRNMMLFSMGSEKFALQLPQDTPDAQDTYSEQYTTGKVVNDYLFQDSLPKEFWYIFEVG